MEKKRNLLVKAAVCDARKAGEGVLSAYEKVTLDCAILLANQRARELMGRYSVEIHAGNVVEAEEDVQISNVNGKLELRPNQAIPEERTYLVVNGKLDIAPGCEAHLKHYTGMTVNGKIICPESVVPLLANINLNGKIDAYPDGAILLKGAAVLDRTFRLRAREGALYYAAGQIVALAPDIGFEALAAKNVRFATKKLVVAESLAEAAVPLFDERTELLILPDGCTLVRDNAVLDEALLRRSGGKLYVQGSLLLPKGCAPLLEQLSFLRVDGVLLAAKGLEEAVHRLDAAYESLCIVGGTLLQDRTNVQVSREMLEQAEDGLSMADCVHVTFDTDVPAALIRERLVSVTDCVHVICTEDQRPAIEAVAADVVHMGPGGEDTGEGEPDGDTSKVFAALYVL